MVIKCLKSLPADTSWNNVKTILRQLFSFVPIVTHAATQLMHKYQQEGENVQEFNFEFCELIQALMSHEPENIIDPLKIHMYAQT